MNTPVKRAVAGASMEVVVVVVVVSGTPNQLFFSPLRLPDVCPMSINSASASSRRRPARIYSGSPAVVGHGRRIDMDYF
jgi:hypothetical protein